MTKVILVIVLCLFSVGIAHADSTTLYTSVFTLDLPPNSSNALEACILNVSKSAREVTTVIVKEGATPSQTVTFILESGESRCVTAIGGCHNGCHWHCEFVVEGSKSHYRASANILQNRIPIAVIPAQ